MKTLHSIILFLSVLFFFSNCVKKETCYIDLGKEKERVYTIPDSILQFDFFALDKNKILLQINDTSRNKLLLDLQNGKITTLDLSAKGFKGIYKNNYVIDSVTQRFWQNKDTELEMYDTKIDKFYYFPKVHFNDILFLKERTIFATLNGLKVFDNQSFTIDSIRNVPPWDYLIEKENEESIFINIDHRYNIETKVLEPLLREEVRKRIRFCYSSESNERYDKHNQLNVTKAWDYSISRQNGVLMHWVDNKNIYALLKGKLVVLNKAFWKKEDEYKFFEKENTTDSIKEKYNNDEDVNYEEIDIDAFFALNTKNVSQNLSFSNRKLAYFKIWDKRFPKQIDTVSNKDKYYKAIRLQKTFDSLLLNNTTKDVVLYHKIELVKLYYYLINTYHFEPTYESIRAFEWNTCQKILKQYPNSIYADDIELGIYKGEISLEENFGSDYTIKSISKLKKIIAKYPKSNLRKEFELEMIRTYAWMQNDDLSDSLIVFNYNLKGAKMLVDFYLKNPNYYSPDENEEDAKDNLKFAKENLESLKFQQNIRVSLSCPQKEYNRKEPIVLTYSIKNVGQDEQEIETNEIDGLAHHHLLFNVLNYPTEGCAVDSVIYFQRILKETPKSTKRILKVGEVANFQIDITKLANLRAKEFSEFENPLKYCRYPNSYGRLEFLQPQTLEIYIDNYYRFTPSNKLLIKIK